MGIGSAGTTAVKPSNPLYESVKAGGGYVIDEETGEVTGGPDGDGTAQTEAERLRDSNNAMDAHPDAEGYEDLESSDNSASTTDLIESVEDAVDDATNAAEQAQAAAEEQSQTNRERSSMSTSGTGPLGDLPPLPIIGAAGVAVFLVGRWV